MRSLENPLEQSIPHSISEVTTEWLGRALGADRYGVMVTAMTADRVGEGVGIMSEAWRLALDYDQPAPELPRSVIVKLTSSHAENREHGTNLGLYDAEVRFYRDLAAGTSTRIPLCYHAVKDPNGADFAIVMQDLGGFTMVDQSVGLSRPQSERAVIELAALHESWWGRVDGPELEWVPSLIHPRAELMAGFWPQLWPVFAERFAAALPEGGLQVGEVASRMYWPVLQKLSEQPWTLLHMDFRCENFMFDTSGEMFVLDWQTLGRGAVAYDLAYLLGGSLPVEDRRAGERALVELYHRELTSSGKVEVPFGELWDAYRMAHLAAGTSTAVLTGASMDLGNRRGVELVETMANRHFTAAVDLDSADLIG